jgi:RNA polymerase sigma-70 factor (ECF subfamily)
MGGGVLMAAVQPDSAETQTLLLQAHTGDRRAFEELFARHRDSLRWAIEIRLDAKLRARVDPSDVVQETHLEAYQRLADYLERRPMPFRLWLRKTAYERLLKIQRHHLKTARRAVSREVPLPEQSSLLLADQLLADVPTPSQQIGKGELARKLRGALTQLPLPQREVLLMRNFEGLSYQEVACILEIDPATARKRYGRALLQLRHLLLEGGLTESEI